MILLCVLRLIIHCWSVFTVLDKLFWYPVQLEDMTYLWTSSNNIGLSSNSIGVAFATSDIWDNLIATRKSSTQSLLIPVTLLLHFRVLLSPHRNFKCQLVLSLCTLPVALSCLHSPCCAPTAHGSKVFKGNILLQNKRLSASAQKPLRKVCNVQDFPTGFRIPVGLGNLPIQPWVQNLHP